MGSVVSSSSNATTQAYYHRDVVVASEFTKACEGTQAMLKTHAANNNVLKGYGVQAYTPPFCMRITSDPTLLTQVLRSKYNGSVVVYTDVEEERLYTMDSNENGDPEMIAYTTICVCPAAAAQ